MQDFTLHLSTKIIMGADAEKQVGKEAAAVSKNVLLVHTGSQRQYAQDLLQTVRASLEESGVTYCELTGIVPNPLLPKVREGIELARGHGVGLILAIGGGSVIDTAKAVAMGARLDGDIWDVFLGNIAPKDVLPIGAVVTYPAAGSEMSESCVITNPQTLQKLGHGNRLIRPTFALLNPRLTMALSARQTFAGADDMMAHLRERYFSHTPATDLLDGMAESMMRSIIKNALILKDNPGDYDARAEIMLAGALAHNDLTGCGKAQDWASHRIGMVLSAYYDSVHGETLSVIFPAWATYVYNAHVQKFADFAVNVFGASPNPADPAETALEGIRLMKEFFVSIGMPVSLKELGVPCDKLDEMAAKCTERSPQGNIKRLGAKDVRAIYELAK